jgi:glycosyltransferase involved in cell wall biosynthesis
MKFAFISTMDGWQWGGSEELWSQTATQLKLEGHDVQASVAHWPIRSEKIDTLVQQGIEIETRGGQPRNIWRKLNPNFRHGFDRLKAFSPDLVIISQGYNAGGFDWARNCIAAGIPYVLIIQCNYENWWFPDEALNDAVASYTGARKVFCVSHGNLNLLRFQVGDPLPNAEVVWNPYSVSSECVPIWPDVDGLLQLACVARLEPTAKGQDLLLRVFSHERWRERPVRLNFYGTGFYEQSLRRMAEMLQVKNVSFQGHVNDIEAIWARNHVLVLPSRYEGLPLALVEAMWCARPSVVTDVGGNAELCVEGETGFIASAPTASSIDGALELAWAHRDEWQSIGKAARARADALVPKNPIGLFSEKLKSCAASVADRSSVGEAVLQNR